jgi:hypothetical protein
MLPELCPAVVATPVVIGTAQEPVNSQSRIPCPKAILLGGGKGRG